MIIVEGGVRMTQIYFHKEITCSICKNEIIAVGNVIGEPMTTGPDNVLAENVVVGSLLTTEGSKEDIRFDVKCPNCKNKSNEYILR